MDMSFLEVYGVLGTGILIMIAMGSLSMLLMQFIYLNTSKRLNKIEEELREIKEIVKSSHKAATPKS